MKRRFRAPPRGGKIVGMVTVLTIVGVSYAAYRIWLIVRIVNQKKKWSIRLKWTS